MKQVKRNVKYLGIWLDAQDTSCILVIEVVAKTEKVTTKLAMLMPNVGVPKSSSVVWGNPAKVHQMGNHDNEL